MKKDIEESAWETDADGKRFRRIGNTLEYEMEVLVNGVYVPESRLSGAKSKKVDYQRFEEKQLRTFCPFTETKCSENKCALFLDGCALAQLSDRQPTKATEGLQCPLSRNGYKCHINCALYRNGCILAAPLLNKKEIEICQNLTTTQED